MAAVALVLSEPDMVKMTVDGINNTVSVWYKDNDKPVIYTGDVHSDTDISFGWVVKTMVADMPTPFTITSGDAKDGSFTAECNPTAPVDFSPTMEMLDGVKKLVETTLWLTESASYLESATPGFRTAYDASLVQIRNQVSKMRDSFPENARDENPYSEGLVEIAGGRLGTALALLNAHLNGGGKVSFQLPAELNVTYRALCDYMEVKPEELIKNESVLQARSLANKMAEFDFLIAEMNRSNNQD